MGAGSTFHDPRFVLRTTLALALANARYWTTVAPTVRGELRRWREHARAIEDPELRALALGKLEAESFHAQAAAMLATSAPRSHRRDVVQAIVALELLFDYLDGLTERPSADPLGEGERLFRAYIDAVAIPAADDTARSSLDAHGDLPFADAEPDDDGYLSDLSRAVATALARLPAATAIAEIARRTARQAAQAQTRMHAAAQLGTEQVEQWARGEVEGTDLQWHELLAGAASSVLVLHALIAAATDPRTTPRQATEIAAAYLPTCTLLTLLDGLVDRDDDDTPSSGAEHLSYISFHQDPDELSRTLTGALRRASTHMRTLPHGPRHATILVGVVAYYTSTPAAGRGYARPICRDLQRRLRPMIYPALALMRTWRLAKRLRAGNRRPSSVTALASSAGQPHTQRERVHEI
jgi:tetraprenyl-beta-curcumene synthase